MKKIFALLLVLVLAAGFATALAEEKTYTIGMSHSATWASPGASP